VPAPRSRPPGASSADLVVLGAGPAGLAAAWRAAREGLSVTVLDRADAVGGMAASFDVAGVRVDHGSHRLHPATPPAVLADIQRLLGADLQLRPRNGRLRVGGAWVGFPLRAAELARALPPSMLARGAADMLTRPLRRGSADSYAGALRHSLGPTLYGALYSPYARKLWGLDGEEIDAEQARKRVSADTPLKIARRILFRRGSGQGRVFYYPRRGFGQIAEALAEAATAAGADIRLGAEVRKVSGATVTTAGGEQVTGGHLLSTVPLPVLARLSQPGPPDGVLEDAGRLRFRAMVLAYVVHDGRPWTQFDAHYLPGPDTPITRVSEPANYRDSPDDPRDRTVLCCELPCDVGDPVWTASDDELGAIVTGTLAHAALPPLNVAGIHVKRLRHVYPVYARGYAEHLRGLDTWAGTLPDVTTFGRLGLFVHDNTHHAMVMAYDVVDAVRAGRRDEPAWAAARARFATHVVED
jgi:protoporphyrinogen oxidase